MKCGKKENLKEPTQHLTAIRWGVPLTSFWPQPDPGSIEPKHKLFIVVYQKVPLTISLYQTLVSVYLQPHRNNIQFLITYFLLLFEEFRFFFSKAGLNLISKKIRIIFRKNTKLFLKPQFRTLRYKFSKLIYASYFWFLYNKLK